RGAILILEFGDEVGDGTYRSHRADALTRSPDVLPRLCLGIAARTEVHRLQIAFGQILGVHARRDDRLAEVVAVHAGEEVRIDDVGGAALDDAVFIALLGIRLDGRYESAADIGEVGAAR